MGPCMIENTVQDNPDAVVMELLNQSLEYGCIAKVRVNAHIVAGVVFMVGNRSEYRCQP